MAEAFPSLRTEINKCMECELCLEEITDPKVLPCQHTFCCKCIQGLVECNPQSKCIPCPLCREKWDVPSEGPTGLKTNLLMKRLLSIKGHNANSRTCAYFCEKHPDEKLKVFCNTDKNILCFECIAKDHSGHDFIDIAQAAELHEEELRNDIEAQLKVLRKKAQSFMQERDLVKAVHADRLKVEAAIEKAFSSIIESITEHHNYPVSEIDESLHISIATEESKLTSLAAIKSKGQSGNIEMIKTCQALKLEGFPRREYAQCSKIMTLTYKPSDISKEAVTFGKLTTEDTSKQVPQLAPRELDELEPGQLCPRELVPEHCAPENHSFGQLDPGEFFPRQLDPPSGHLSPRQLTPEHSLRQIASPAQLTTTSLESTFELIGPGQIAPEPLNHTQLSPKETATFSEQVASKLAPTQKFSPVEKINRPDKSPLTGELAFDHNSPGQAPCEQFPMEQQDVPFELHSITTEPANPAQIRPLEQHFPQTGPGQLPTGQLHSGDLTLSGTPASSGEPISDQFDSYEFAWRIEPGELSAGHLILRQIAPKPIPTGQITSGQVDTVGLSGPGPTEGQPDNIDTGEPSLVQLPKQPISQQLEDLSLGQLAIGEIGTLSKEDLESLVLHNLNWDNFDADNFSIQLGDFAPKDIASRQPAPRELTVKPRPPGQVRIKHSGNSKHMTGASNEREDTFTITTVGKLSKERFLPFENVPEESQVSSGRDIVAADSVSARAVPPKLTTTDEDLHKKESLVSTESNPCATMTHTVNQQSEIQNIHLTNQQLMELTEPDIYTSSEFEKIPSTESDANRCSQP